MRGVLGVGCLLMCLLVLGCKNGGGRESPGGTGGSDRGIGGAGGSGGLGGAGGVGGAAAGGGFGGSLGGECEPGTTQDCYTGPPGTVNVGACSTGIETCNEEGTGFGPCEDEVVPTVEMATAPGETPVDEDCDGMIDET